MRAVSALALVLLLVPLSASAKTINVRGEGVATCTAWTREHTDKTTRYPVQDSWLLGYVNAVAGMLDVPGVDDVSATFHNADLVTWMSEYCVAHPDDVVILAADALMRELARLAK